MKKRLIAKTDKFANESDEDFFFNGFFREDHYQDNDDLIEEIKWKKNPPLKTEKYLVKGVFMCNMDVLKEDIDYMKLRNQDVQEFTKCNQGYKFDLDKIKRRAKFTSFKCTTLETLRDDVCTVNVRIAFEFKVTAKKPEPCAQKLFLSNIDTKNGSVTDYDFLQMDTYLAS